MLKPCLVYRDIYKNFPIYDFPPEVINVVNIVGTFNFGTDIDIEKLLQNCEVAEIKKFVAVKIRICPPRVTLSIFNTGSAIVIGATNRFVVRESADIFTKIVRKALRDDSVKINNFRFHNYTVSCKIPFEINLEKMLMNDPYTSKSPFFPTYEISFPNTKIKCGCSAIHLNITGIKSEAEAEFHYKKFKEHVFQYRLLPGETQQPKKKSKKLKMISEDIQDFDFENYSQMFDYLQLGGELKD